MDTFIDMLTSRADRLIGRAGGPLNFRLLIMPLVVAFLAVRAGMRDARKGRAPFCRTVLTNPAERWRLVISALKDVGKIFVVAVVLDTTYQLVFLEAFYLGELLVVAAACAISPYLVIRSAVSPLMRRIYRMHPKAAAAATPLPGKDAVTNPTPKLKADH